MFLLYLVAKAKAKPGRPFKLFIPFTYTYNMAITACLGIGKRLCTKIEICPDGSPLYGVNPNSDLWTPIADDYNNWVQLGMYCSFFIYEISYMTLAQIIQFLSFERTFKLNQGCRKIDNWGHIFICPCSQKNNLF